MAVRVLIFDPMNSMSTESFERELDSYLTDGWEILQAVAGNRPGVSEGTRTIRTSHVLSPEHKDYVVFVLRNAVMVQPVSH